MNGFAIELYFDAETERRVRELRSRLTKAGIPPLLDELGDRPHISLAVLRRFSEMIEYLVQETAELCAPFAVTLGAIGAFPGGVIYLAPAISPELVHHHAGMHAMLDAGSIDSEEYYLPGNWVPHCTIAMEVRPEQMAAGMDAALRSFAPIHGTIREMGIVGFRPVTPICVRPLRGSKKR